MSYLSWRNTEENEAKYMRKANNGEIYDWPVFNESSFDKALDELVKPGIKSILENEDISLPAFICVFAEYLHEVYNLTPADAEILVQTCTALLVLHVNNIDPNIFTLNEETGEIELTDSDDT